MRLPRLARAATGVAVAVTLALPACAKNPTVEEEQTLGKDIAQLAADALPAEIGGLKVQREDMEDRLRAVKRSYVDSVGLYSLRRDDVVQATIQVSRFNDEADWKDGSFRSSVVRRIGGTVPQAVRVGDETVYVTRGTKQSLSVWWRGRNLIVLAVRDEFERPRTLLRDALEVEV